MFVIGLTGGLGSGKSTVAALFAQRGAVVLDADQIGHTLISSRGPCFKSIVKRFGNQILDSKGEINRQKLSMIVFRDPKDLKALNKIVHPQIFAEIKKEITRLRRVNTPVVIDAALLIEAGWYRLADCVVVVRATRALQLKRVSKRMGLSRAQALLRIQRQMTIDKQLRYADITIDNRRRLAQTKKQVQQIWDRLCQRNLRK